MGENGATKLNAAHITIEHGISSTELEKKLLTPSASSIVLELLGRTAKQKSSELGIIITPSASSAVRCNHNTAQMSANNPVVPNTSEGAGDGNPPINLPPSKQKPNHNSVVPQLMDIYDDLAQSSTPQTTTMSSVPMTQAQSTMGGVHYPGYLSLDSNSQTSERSTRRRSGSQSPHTAAEADASSATSVALARARRTNAKFKAYDDLEEHYGGSVGSKQPVRKKGKVSSADNRWSKRFTWPDEVSTGHSTLIASVQLIISVNTLTVPPPLLCLMPAYLNLTATSRFRIRHFRCRPQACKPFRHPGIHDAKPRHYKRTSQEPPAKVSFESSEEPEGIYAKLRLRAGGIPNASGAITS